MSEGLKFSELSTEAKEHAKNKHAELFGYSGADETITSLKKLAEHFDGALRDYGIDFFGATYSHASFDMPEMSEAEIRDRLKALGSFNRKTLRGDGECKLTGYSADEDAIDGFRRGFYLGQYRDLDKLMQAAFREAIKQAQDNCAAEYSDESFEETAEANGYRYCVHGDLI